MKSNWYALNVKTGNEFLIANFLIEKNGLEGKVAVFSTEFLFKRKGKLVPVKRAMFPGYIFVDTFVKDAIRTIRRNFAYEIIRPVCLRTKKCNVCFGAKSPCKIRDEEMKSLINLTDNTFTLKLSRVIDNGDDVEIISGPLKSIPGKVIHINKRKNVARVQLSLFGHEVKTYLGLDVIKKKSLVPLNK